MTTGDKAELLPCPFCGGDPKITNGFHVRNVFCPTCDAVGPAGNDAEGTARWNTRAPSPPSEVAAVAKSLRELSAWLDTQRPNSGATCWAAANMLEAAGVSGVPEGCAFCGRPVGSDPVYDEVNGETACKTCGDAEKVAQKREAILSALKSYSQADDDGVMCIVSRQAVDEAIVLLAAAPER